MDNELSPYSPPKGELETVEEPPEIIPAGKWLRLANLLIDYVTFSLLGALMGFGFAFIFGPTAVEHLQAIPNFILGTVVTLLYYVICEGLTGLTLGKLITRTKVVNAHGKKATLPQVIGRSFARVIPFEAFSFLGPTGRGWHDSLSKTYVIKRH